VGTPTTAPSKPVYLGSEEHDDLMRVCLRLLSEVWTLRDRLSIVETLLEERAGISRATIDTYEPNAALAQVLAAERQALIKRVLDAPFEAEPLEVQKLPGAE
jgi:hypothetical protein